MDAGGGAGGELGAARVSQDGRGGGAPAGVQAESPQHGVPAACVCVRTHAGVRARVLSHLCVRAHAGVCARVLSHLRVRACRCACARAGSWVCPRHAEAK
jgi:hypothetical protein